MFFPIIQLPLELALEIIRLAATPDIQSNNTQSPVPAYQNAKALCLVSHGFREATMPHLLHTVILADTIAVQNFTRALQMQAALAEDRSSRTRRLALDYRALVRHFYCSYYGFSAEDSAWHAAQSPEAQRGRQLLHDIARNTRSVGFAFNALYLLCDIVGGGSSAAAWEYESEDGLSAAPRCRRLTLSGMGIRWNPILSSCGGLAFLANLTHLTLWVPTHASDAGRPGGPVPYWLHGVPLEKMPNLTHFAFSLNHQPQATKMDVLVYTCPPNSYMPTKQGHIFRQWAQSANPLEHGRVVQVDTSDVRSVQERSFEQAFLRAAAARQVQYY